MVSCSGNNRMYIRMLIIALAVILPLLAASSASAQSAKTGGADPLVAGWFELTAGGKSVGIFREVAGIGSEMEVIDRKLLGKGGKVSVQKTPGNVKWLDVTLKRGLSSDASLWEWHKQVEDGDITNARKDFSIIMFDQNGSPVAQWDFTKGWPSRIEAALAQSSSASSTVVESITLVHEGMSRSK
jgi:phage tail-like protein